MPSPTIALPGTVLPRHLAADLASLRGQSFNRIVLALSEEEMALYAAGLPEMVRLAHQAGYEVWADPWGHGRLFGNGPDSPYLASHPEARRTDEHGEPLPRACCSDRGFLTALHDWVDQMARARVDAILWDEPDLDRCCCGTCSVEESWAMLRSLTFYAAACGLRSSLCLHCLPYVEPRDGTRLDLAANLPYVDDVSLSLVPAQYAEVRHPETIDAYFESWAQATWERVLAFGKTSLVWCQAYEIPAGAEWVIDRTIQVFTRHGFSDFGIWGRDGSGYTSVASDDPAAVSATIERAFPTPTHFLTNLYGRLLAGGSYSTRSPYETL